MIYDEFSKIGGLTLIMNRFIETELKFLAKLNEIDKEQNE